MTEVGNNVQVQEIEGKLHIIIDPKANLGPSASGKMIGVASTGGFTVIPGGMKLNLYLGRKA
jgi:hypothetical protein